MSWIDQFKHLHCFHTTVTPLRMVESPSAGRNRPNCRQNRLGGAHINRDFICRLMISASSFFKMGSSRLFLPLLSGLWENPSKAYISGYSLLCLACPFLSLENLYSSLPQAMVRSYPFLVATLPSFLRLTSL